MLVASVFSNSFVVHSQNNVNDTFESDGHVYEMEHIFNNFNIFAFSDATGAHINGPVISGGGVFKLAENSFDINVPSWNNQKSPYGPIVSDFSRSVPNNNSYIKGDYATTGGYNNAKRLYVGVDNDNHVDKIKNNPNVEIIKTDTYMDWNKAYDNLTAQSHTLLSQAKTVLTLDDVIYTQYNEGYIIVREGDNLLISEEVFNAYSHLVYINDGKPFDLQRITLNYDVSGTLKEKINVVTNDERAALDGKLNLGALHHSLAYDGYHPNGPNVIGDEQAINIIHNYPKAQTIINSNSQRFGQLFAPQATVYDNAGNVNGNMIVHALYSPNSEPHFWPLGSTPEIPKVRLYAIEGYKLDFDTEQALAGATISLYDQDQNLMKSTVTLENGYFLFDDLRAGIYTVSETQAPSGYELGDNSETIHLSINSEALVSLIFKNKKIEPEIPEETRYSIYGTKKDFDTHENLAGAEISLYDDSLNLRTQTMTDKEGFFEFTNLKAGTYIVKETKAPEGYDLGNNQERIHCDENSDHSLSFVFYNKKLEDEVPKDNHYSISGYKQDMETKDTLAGAEISLYDQNNKLLESYLTEEDGYFQFMISKPGTYYIEETGAPLGYLLGDNRFEVIVSDENNNIIILIENERIPEPEKPGGKDPMKPKPEDPNPELPKPEEPKPVLPKPEEPKPEVTQSENPKNPDAKDSLINDKETSKDVEVKTPHTAINQNYFILLYTNVLLLGVAIILKSKKTSH